MIALSLFVGAGLSIMVSVVIAAITFCIEKVIKFVKKLIKED